MDHYTELYKDPKYKYKTISGQLGALFNNKSTIHINIIHIEFLFWFKWQENQFSHLLITKKC